MRRFLSLWVIMLFCWAAPAIAKDDSVQTSWRLLDYIAVDYPGAVSDSGKVLSDPEYAEMREFSGSVRQNLNALPDKPAKRDLLAKSQQLGAAIDAKAPPQTIARLARSLGSDLLGAYPVPLGPRSTPDLSRGEQLFRQTCSSCHGVSGDAKTEMAAKLDPHPVAFTDRARAKERSPFALYQVIDQGLEGTAMVSFSSLPAQDRWDLAYYASRFAYPQTLVAEGRRLWESDSALHAIAPARRNAVPSPFTR